VAGYSEIAPRLREQWLKIEQEVKYRNNDMNKANFLIKD